ncbi:hypothetical protein THAOC_21096 [Thalassiosira oceanica]|uniref:Triosephosphate isomerase n=1 Tax=Thalassiosira oceanica TaxID=159749 RepID=K0RYC4_THAOC|nr:hypothetical protein THAOC_21096 [Thalassiosira oceanica]|eukprot:EJK58753.1 hypothetical protein THAOC_21096 [Thalassiosira oceanica]
MTRPEGSSKGSPAPGQAHVSAAPTAIQSHEFPNLSSSEGSRKYLIGGNWKSNGTIASVEKIVADFNGAGPIPANAEVVIGCPYIHIPLLLSTLRSDIEVAAQNCSLTGMGAYTGEITASQLKDLGVNWVILGHSERREGFGMAGEDSELVAKKTKMALSEGLKVMLCIGEKKEEREAGTTMDVCAEQLKPAAAMLSKEDWANVSIAYEPVWAIGTGLTGASETIVLI